MHLFSRILLLVFIETAMVQAFSCSNFEPMSNESTKFRCVGFSTEINVAPFPSNATEIYAYYPTGELMLIANFKNGMQWGQSIVYYKDGTVRETRKYAADILDGPDIIYDDSGNPIVITEYTMGEPLKTTAFNPDGTTSFIQDYCNGSLCKIRYFLDKEIVKSCTQITADSVETTYFADGEACDVFVDAGTLMELHQQADNKKKKPLTF